MESIVDVSRKFRKGCNGCGHKVCLILILFMVSDRLGRCNAETKASKTSPDSGGIYDQDAKDGDIRIMGVAGGAQALPYHYLQHFQRWVLLEDGEMVSIPSATATREEGDFVPPTSTTHLWWPMDLPKLDARPTMDVVIQNGQPKYVCAGLDIRALSPSSNGKPATEWRNHGLKSAPLARQWLPFSIASLPKFEVEAFLANTFDSEGKLEWKSLAEAGDSSSLDAREALERFGLYWAQLDGTDKTSSVFLEGFHVVSIPTSDQWTNLPYPQQTYLLASLASTTTEESTLVALLEAPASTTTSFLVVEVMQTAPGGKPLLGLGLPQAYERLYQKRME